MMFAAAEEVQKINSTKADPAEKKEKGRRGGSKKW